jgi:hypothetical protein
MVTLIHAVVACSLALVSNLVVGPLAYYAIGEPNTPLQTLTLQDLTRPAPLTDCRKVQRCRHPAAALPG